MTQPTEIKNVTQVIKAFFTWVFKLTQENCKLVEELLALPEGKGQEILSGNDQEQIKELKLAWIKTFPSDLTQWLGEGDKKQLFKDYLRGMELEQNN